jgi:glycosyltransferase involved in cell wall biosynthesis
VLSRPSVTIHIPVYNEKKFIAQAVESAINQTYGNLKILITDNCSTDGTFEILKTFAEKDNRIIVQQHRKNIGATANFKQGPLACNTDYFCWLGGHDIFLPEYIERAVEILEKNDHVAMVYPASRFISREGILLEPGGSDIDTTREKDMNNKIYKVVKNLANCVAIHGVCRLQVAKNFPFVKTIGHDHLMLFSILNWGNIQGLNYEGIHRREIRNETESETLERLLAYGLFKQTSVNPYAFLAAEHYNYVLKNFNQISLRKKLSIINGLQEIFFNRFKVTRNDLIRIYLGLYGT